jgi:hypothetical protein
MIVKASLRRGRLPQITVAKGGRTLRRRLGRAPEIAGLVTPVRLSL